VPAKFDAVVIGAGVIGAATALGLARKGRKVLCVDKLPAAGYGSTSGSCAIIRPYYSTVDGSAIAYESHYYWQEWADFLGVDDERGLARYVNCGCMVLKTEANGYLERAADLMEEIGCPYEHLDADQVKARLPIVALQCYAPAKAAADPAFGQPSGGEIGGAMFFPAGGYVTDPQLAAHNLQRAAEAHGAVFRFNCAVEAIVQDGDRVSGVTLAGGEAVTVPVVVNVAGPHSYKINDMAGVTAGMNIATRALRHEVAHVPSPKGFDFEHHGMVVSDSDTSAYLRPEHGNHILVGSEDPECDPREWVDPDDFNRDFTDHVRTLALRAAQRMPDLPIPNRMKGVVELYDVSDDWIPIYDKSDLPGFYMAVGTSGNQFKNAPIVGELMADLIEACEAGDDHDADPVPFHLKHIDRTVSIGFYSRRREINRSSSFSVLG
jgi:sarcosine oxidase, subunit beta